MLSSKANLVLACLIVLNGNVFAFTPNNSTNHELCSSLENKTGTCVPIHECNPIVSTLLSKKPLSQDVIDVLKELHCGFEERTPKVCCPSEEIDNSKLKNSSAIAKNRSKISLLPELENCGLFISNRVHSYARTELGEYPWNALLAFRTGNDTKFFCGGALISSRYVLTAAHCISKSSNFEFVRLGEHTITTNPDCDDFEAEVICADEVLDIPIEKTIVHERYNPNDANHHFDVALIRLTEDVAFTHFINPVCLPPLLELDKDEAFGTRPFTITGWGIASDRQKVNFKHQFDLELKDVNECKLSPKYKNLGLNLTYQLCAKSRPGNDLCHADDGAVLTGIIPGYSWYGNNFAVGISSFDIDQCGKDTDYIIFTKVKDYIPWIYEKLE